MCSRKTKTIMNMYRRERHLIHTASKPDSPRLLSFPRPLVLALRVDGPNSLQNRRPRDKRISSYANTTKA